VLPWYKNAPVQECADSSALDRSPTMSGGSTTCSDPLAGTAFGLEAMLDVSSRLADDKRNDIRIEAAPAKRYGSELGSTARWLPALTTGAGQRPGSYAEYRVAQQVLAGRYEWSEHDVLSPTATAPMEAATA
jgi:hypothetical protein